jgi:hypothetical protein
MSFVIRADDAGRISWLTPANERGFHSLTDRSGAAIFPTRETAQAAIDMLSAAYARMGIRFTIEPADSD